jgi:thioredoxin reductase
MDKIIDCAVVGAGIAGLSAALFLGRAGRSTVVFDGGKPRILLVDTMREHLGFDGMPSATLLAHCREEVRRYGVRIQPERVSQIVARADGLFDIQCGHGLTTARTVVLATGVIDELPALNGLAEAWGNDLRVCPCFDGHDVRDGRFVVFGLPERLAHMASWVSMWSADVTVISTHTFNDADLERIQLSHARIVHDEVAGLVRRDGNMVAVATVSGAEVAADAVWIAANVRAASNLAASLCEVDQIGLAITDKFGRTSLPGLYAIGNARDAVAHVAHASADGTTVGPMVTMYLLEQRLAARRDVQNQACHAH